MLKRNQNLKKKRKKKELNEEKEKSKKMLLDFWIEMNKNFEKMNNNVATRTRILNNIPVDIFQFDFESICPEIWISGSVINYISSFLLDEKKNPKFKIMSTTFFNWTSKKVLEHQLKEMEEIFSTLPEFVLVPMNWKNEHWFLCAIDVKNRKTFYFDSLISSDRSNISKLFFYSFPQLRGFEFTPKRIWEQKDGTSCGIFVIGLLMEFFKSGNFVFVAKTEQDIQLKRKELVEIILQETDQTRKNLHIQNIIHLRKNNSNKRKVEPLVLYKEKDSKKQKKNLKFPNQLKNH